MTTRSENKALLEEAVASLAEGCTTADEVAAKLAAAGITGQRRKPHQCPITRWITRYLNEHNATFVRVTTGGDYSCVITEDLENPGIIADLFRDEAGLPAPVAAFRDAFDNARGAVRVVHQAPTLISALYPELVEVPE
jgi:hypothetical protein